MIATPHISREEAKSELQKYYPGFIIDEYIHEDDTGFHIFINPAWEVVTVFDRGDYGHFEDVVGEGYSEGDEITIGDLTWKVAWTEEDEVGVILSSGEEVEFKASVLRAIETLAEEPILEA